MLNQVQHDTHVHGAGGGDTFGEWQYTVVMVPRIVISSPSSSSGKTTVVTALAHILSKRFPSLSVLKVGPDFIDPLFHAEVAGVRTGNIDVYFSGEAGARRVFAKDTAGSDFALVEGAMGFFDGVGGNSSEASAFSTARAIGSRVILVVDMKGKGLSACAEISGFLRWKPDSALPPAENNGISAVILNRCSASLYEKIAPKIRERCGVETLGFLEQNADFAIESRHLGLVTPDAVERVREKIARIASALEKTVDVARISELALSVEGEDEKIAPPAKRSVVRIAVARDEAFSFYYRENFDALREAGAELCFFSPLKDERVPDDCSALYIGGGYPELFVSRLCESARAAASVRAFARMGKPVYAECGGFLYLQMLGILPGTFWNAGHLVRFGYAEFTCGEDTFLLKKGERVRGHEFHHFDTSDNGSSFTARKPDGTEWQCVTAASPVDSARKPCCQKRPAAFAKNIVAGFPHLYFPSNPHIAENIVEAALLFDSLSASSAPSCAGCAGCAKGER